MMKHKCDHNAQKTPGHSIPSQAFTYRPRPREFIAGIMTAVMD